MGLNWAAALDQVSQGIGRIAQFRYSEFLREETNKQQMLRDELAHEREMNRARFQLKGQQDIAAQSQTWQSGENAASRLLQQQQIEQQGKYQTESLKLQQQQAAGVAADRAANADLRRLQIQQLQDAAAAAKEDKQFKDSITAFDVALKTTQPQIEQLYKQLEKTMDPTQQQAIQTQINELQMTSASAMNGMMNAMKGKINLSLTAEQQAAFELELKTPNADGSMKTVLDALNDTIRKPISGGGAGGEPTVPPAPDQGGGSFLGGAAMPVAAATDAASIPVSPYGMIKTGGRALGSAMMGAVDDASAAFGDAGMTPSLSGEVPATGSGSAYRTPDAMKILPRALQSKGYDAERIIQNLKSGQAGPDDIKAITMAGYDPDEAIKFYRSVY